jgi:hypothetical protein
MMASFHDDAENDGTVGVKGKQVNLGGSFPVVI